MTRHPPRPPLPSPPFPSPSIFRLQTCRRVDGEVTLPQLEARPYVLAAFRRTGATSATVRRRAMATAPGGDALLAELKAVDAAYPLYGIMRLESGARRG